MNTHFCILCGYNSQEKLNFIRQVVYIILVLNNGRKSSKNIKI